MMIYDELIYVRILELQQYICMILLIATTWKPKYPLMSRNCLLSSHGCCGWQLKMYFFWTKSRILIKCKPIPAENHFFVHLLEIWKLLNALSARQRVCGPRRLLAAGNKGNLNPDKNYEISRPPQAGPPHYDVDDDWELGRGRETQHKRKLVSRIGGVFDRYLQNMVLQFDDPKTTKLTQLDNTS